MLPRTIHELDDQPGIGPIFAEEKQDDGSIRYYMNEKLRKHAEAAVARLSSEKITDFERQVLEAVQTWRA